ncbi:MAG: Zn-dependent hydrolase, partial [Acidobacteria bacterium]|nr:Zn-dependent hydrolase [Acidobacteriota bacterium]
IARDAQGMYVIDYAKIPGALASLTKELLEIEATGDRARAEAWFARYEKMPAELHAALEAARDVPVDIDPLVPFREGVD